MCNCTIVISLYSFVQLYGMVRYPVCHLLCYSYPLPPDTATDHDANSLLEAGLGGAGDEQ